MLLVKRRMSWQTYFLPTNTHFCKHEEQAIPQHITQLYHDGSVVLLETRVSVNISSSISWVSLRATSISIIVFPAIIDQLLSTDAAK